MQKDKSKRRPIVKETREDGERQKRGEEELK
jgi:hypothetical protein